ncbi:MAG: Na+/H+ antiporter NhaA [Actinomycetota bacterium]|nr:Na+/H+ antiporter NhaA [Actinomycetota bacterium]
MRRVRRDRPRSGAGGKGAARAALRAFLRMEASGGIVLVAAALVAVVWANSPAGDLYQAIWHIELRLGVGRFSLVEDLRHWVNDALMVLFFFVVGLEIKREVVTGELRDPRAATLPAVAALGGVVLPALLFLGLVGSGPGSRGWGIPMATDIAFAVGVLALLGDRVPGGAKLLLLSIAIVDDILAIGVIAVVYTQAVSLAWLAAAVGLLGLVAVLRRVGVVDVWPYVVVGVAVWLATFESGVHATIAGVALGLLTPAGEVGGRPVLQELEHRLHPVSAFRRRPAVRPRQRRGRPARRSPAGREPGPSGTRRRGGPAGRKTLGIGGAALLAQRSGIGALPRGVEARHVWGLAALGGIGFTVSLFVADLAYTAQELTDQAKVGIFAGSLLSALAGAVVLRSGRRLAPRDLDAPEV